MTNVIRADFKHNHHVSDASLSKIRKMLDYVNRDVLSSESVGLFKTTIDSEFAKEDKWQVFFETVSPDGIIECKYIMYFDSDTHEYQLLDNTTMSLCLSARRLNEFEHELHSRCFGTEGTLFLKVGVDSIILQTNDETEKLLGFRNGDHMSYPRELAPELEGLYIVLQKQNTALSRLLGHAASLNTSYVGSLEMTTLKSESISTIWHATPIFGDDGTCTSIWAAGFAISTDRMPDAMGRHIRYLSSKLEKLVKFGLPRK